MPAIENVRDSVQVSMNEIENILLADSELSDLQQEALSGGQVASDSINNAKEHIFGLITNTADALSNSQWASERIKDLTKGLDSTIVASTNLDAHKTNIDFIADCFSGAATDRNEAIKNTSRAVDDLKTISSGIATAISKNAELEARIDAPKEGLMASVERAKDHAQVLQNADNGRAEGFLKNIQYCDEDLTTLSDTAFEARRRIDGATTPLMDLTTRLEETMTLLDSSTRKSVAEFIACILEVQAKITFDDIAALNTLNFDIKDSVQRMETSLGRHSRLQYHARCAVEYGQAFLDKSP